MIRDLFVCRTLRLAGVLLVVGATGACNPPAQPVADAGRPVDVAIVESSTFSDVARLTGDIQAQKDVELSFRIGGKVLDRHVNVGDRVTAGQVLARLDAQTENNSLRAAKAARSAAAGEVEQTRSAFERQDRLMRQGFTTRPRFEQVLSEKETAQARFEETEAQVALAQDRVGFTELAADASGVVIARSLEPGEVVQPGQVVFRVARDDGRDAVFDVAASFLDQKPDDGLFQIVLASDPQTGTTGRVREIAAKADSVTGTFRIRVGLRSPPDGMQLGSTVVGTLEKSSDEVVSIPAGALTMSGGYAAVWIVDPATSRVALRRIEILRFDPTRVIVLQGLEPGDMVVTAGIQALHPGQRVTPMSAGARRAATAHRMDMTAPVMVSPSPQSAEGQPGSFTKRRNAVAQEIDG